MSDVLMFRILDVVPRHEMVVGWEDLIDFRHRAMCAAIKRDVSKKGRAILYPTLRVREEPSDMVDGLELSIRVLTVPMESV